MAPFPIEQILGKGGAYLIYLLIGVSFGVVLEMSGFAKSSKLAAQFYFKEQTVLKVMFTAIVVAMVPIFLTSGSVGSPWPCSGMSPTIVTVASFTGSPAASLMLNSQL